MSEEAVEMLVREVLNALNSHDVEKTLALFSDDGVWITPSGTFKGKAELKRYITWIFETLDDMKLEETGSGLMTRGSNALVEHKQSGIMDGEPMKFMSMCSYEFDENNQVKSLKTIYDRLTLAEQAADKWLEKTVVHAVVKKVQEGLP